ncbi:MAG TPA: efflux RND transporter periplasmic adaptor subunit [Steroidobacteraceae bacterium]|nr:efflux RND transporter periplasmic adaptor subunit [Steroidobacteraceae bacterium]
MRIALWACVLSAVLGCQACGHHSESPPLVRPVRTTVIAYGAAGEGVSLSGQIQAQNQTNLAFRIPGRLLERRVSVGDPVTRGELIARIESQDARNELRSAEAELAAAQAALVQTRNNEQRYRSLVTTGVVSRAQYDDAQQQFAAAQSRVAAATASVQARRDNVGYTELHSDVAGVVTAKGAEPSEVVQAGQMIVQIAQRGGKDAVFNVPAALMRESPHNPTVTVHLVDDQKITAAGHVREISPEADPTTGTFQIKIGLDDPPDTMRLGATVVGNVTLSAQPVVSLPGTALVQIGGRPAVWVVDPRSKTVALRSVAVERYEASAVVISSGLKNGDVVVTAGVHALRPGQPVKLAPNG